MVAEIKKLSSKDSKIEMTLLKQNNVTKEYTVQAGDNLFSIAKENKINVADLKLWNNLTEEVNNVYLGDVLKISGDNFVKFETAEPKIKTNYYTVLKGDNLSEIASKNNVSVSDLKDWNNLKDSNVRLG